eukprot:82320-Karenia_brevis.AAC.1
MAVVKQKWSKERLGVYLDGHLLSNLRFADDVLLLATSLKDLKVMLADMFQSVHCCGLELHPGKTKIL